MTEQRLWQTTKEARRLLPKAITHRNGRYQLDRESVDLDIDELGRLLRETERAAHEAEAHPLLEQALALFRGEPLQGAASGWADNERRLLQAVQTETLVRVAKARLAKRDAIGALDAADQLIELDRLNEQACRLAMQAEAALGQRAAIASRYDGLARILDEQLGLRPSAETRALYLDLLSQDSS